MANARIGPSVPFNSPIAETVSEAKQLANSDSGKIFFVDNSAAFTINLPELSANMAGWNCKFVVSVDGSAVVSLMANGLTSAGGTVGDAESVIYREFQTVDATGTAYTSSQDGMTIAAASVIGDTVDVITDGTSWFMTAMLHEVAHADDVDA